MNVGRKARQGARPLADLLAALVDPVLARKAGMSSGLVAAWPEIVGPRLAGCTRAEKLVWPQRRHDDAPFEPATLVVACEGAFVLRLQHESSELLQRVNAAFGYHAVSRLRIVQRPVSLAVADRKPRLRPLDTADRQTIAAATAKIDHPRLKAALERYGECVLARTDRG